MMKCPHCGSTAQVKSSCDPIISKVNGNLLEGFYCGCGCEWEVEYARNENGYWELYLIAETHKPKEESKGHIHCPCNGTDCPYWKIGKCSLYSAENGWLDPIDECEDFRFFWDYGDDYIDYEG